MTAHCLICSITSIAVSTVQLSQSILINSLPLPPPELILYTAHYSVGPNETWQRTILNQGALIWSRTGPIAIKDGGQTLCQVGTTRPPLNSGSCPHTTAHLDVRPANHNVIDWYPTNDRRKANRYGKWTTKYSGQREIGQAGAHLHSTSAVLAKNKVKCMVSEKLLLKTKNMA